MRWRLVTAIVLVCALITAVCAAGGQPIAVVTDLQGDVRLQRAGQRHAVPLDHTAFLRVGDRLAVGQDGGATLFQLDAPWITLGANRTVTIQPVPLASRVPVLTPDLMALLVKHAAAPGGGVGDRRSAPPRRGNALAITALAPRHSLMLEPRPTFEWRPAGDAVRYQVTLYNDRDIVLWQTTTEGTRAVYPAGRKELRPGEYAWEVLAQGNDREGLDTAPFTVATKHRAAEVQRVLDRAARLVTDPGVTNLPFIAVCLEYRLYPRAEALLMKATARAPQDRVLTNLLKHLYQVTRRAGERTDTRPITIDVK
jgi:hypothetical protein